MATIVPNSFGSDLYDHELREYNDCHNPAGSSEGGQFCSGESGGRARQEGGVAARWEPKVGDRVLWQGGAVASTRELQQKMPWKHSGVITKIWGLSRAADVLLDDGSTQRIRLVMLRNVGADTYVKMALGNLTKTSRTGQGKSETESAGKPTLAIAPGEALKKKATQNFEEAIRHVFQWTVKQPEGRTSPEEIEKIVGEVAGIVTKGLLQPGQSVWRSHETAHGQTSPTDLPGAMQQFYEGLSKRLGAGDPVETAAWIEYQFDIKIHPLADGVGRATKALSAIPFMMRGKPLPKYRDRKEHYSHAKDSWEDWLKYYRSLI